MSKHTKDELKLCPDFVGLAQIEGKTVFVVLPSMCNTPADLALRVANGNELVRRWNSQPDLLEACEKVQDWLDTSSLQQILVHYTEDTRKHALIMGIASHLERLEAAIAKAQSKH